MTFRSHLCFGCAHRTASPHNHTLSKCVHPESLRELAWVMRDQEGSSEPLRGQRPMTVRLYRVLTERNADFPYAYDPQILEHCGAYERRKDDAA